MKSYQVEVGDVRICHALQDLAKDLGWGVRKPSNASCCRWLVIKLKQREVDWNKESNPERHETIGVVEAVEMLKGPKPLTIGEHAVEFRPGGIKVGCVTVDRETVDEIHRRLHEGEAK